MKKTLNTRTVLKGIQVLKNSTNKSSRGDKRTTLKSLFFLSGLVKEILYKLQHIFCGAGAISITLWQMEHAK